MNKQIVFIVQTDENGSGENSVKRCLKNGALVGKVKQVNYITDNRIPFDPAAKAEFYRGDDKEPFLTLKLNSRKVERLDSGPVFSSHDIRCVVSDGGSERAGSFVVTCA